VAVSGKTLSRTVRQFPLNGIKPTRLWQHLALVGLSFQTVLLKLPGRPAVEK